MRKAKILPFMLLVTCALAPIAGHSQDRDRNRDQRGGPSPMSRGHDRDRGWQGGPGHEDRDRVDIDRRADRDRPGRWNRGDRIPPEYRERQYVIDNWRDYRLAPPPRGYHWIGVGGDYFLMAPSGIVFNVVIGG